jgi:hypothetical protein
MKPAKQRYSPQRAPQPQPADTRRLIEEQTEAFLRLGGKIQCIPKGVSGQQGSGYRQAGFASPAKKPDTNS